MRRENRSYWANLPSDLVDTIVERFVQGGGPRLGSRAIIKWVVLVKIPISTKFVVIGECRTIIHRNGAPVTAGDNGNLSRCSTLGGFCRRTVTRSGSIRLGLNDCKVDGDNDGSDYEDQCYKNYEHKDTATRLGVCRCIRSIFLIQKAGLTNG